MLLDAKNQMVYLMDFVQDFERQKNADMIQEPIADDHKPLDALLASTVEAMCLKHDIPLPLWIYKIKPLKEPYFVSGIENLKAITLVESPIAFRKRNVFVLKNFLDRV